MSHPPRLPIEEVIAAYRATGSQAKAARLLGMSESGVHYRLEVAGYARNSTAPMEHDARVARWKARCSIDGNGCWIWPGATRRGGYGHVGVLLGDGSRVNRGLHIVMYEHFVGPVPDGLVLDHLCRVRICCNPAHLEPVTQTENVRRGTGFAGTNAAKTHCPQGHPYDEANTRRSKRGQRHCRACAAQWRRLRCASVVGDDEQMVLS